MFGDPNANYVPEEATRTDDTTSRVTGTSSSGVTASQTGRDRTSHSQPSQTRTTGAAGLGVWDPSVAPVASGQGCAAHPAPPWAGPIRGLTPRRRLVGTQTSSGRHLSRDAGSASPERLRPQPQPLRRRAEPQALSPSFRAVFETQGFLPDAQPRDTFLACVF